jgi:hypothetical protein
LDTSKPPPGLEHLYTIGRHFEGFSKNGQGYKARCPTHDDTNPSLSINVGKDGGVVLHCFAECETTDILAAVGLSMSDLMPAAGEAISREGSAPPKQVAPPPRVKGKPKAAGPSTIAYSYRDEEGEILYQVVRFPNKMFKQRSPDGQGGWRWTTQGVRKVLYRLRSIIRAEYVFIVGTFRTETN